MSLLYFGELWMTEAGVETCQKILDTLQVSNYLPADTFCIDSTKVLLACSYDMLMLVFTL